jgi:cytochrome c553
MLAVLSAGIASVLIGEGRAIAQGASSSTTNTVQGRSQDLPAANVCIGCHSPVDGPPLSGILLGSWLGPNITPDPVSGIGAWSRDDIFRYLRNGNAPGRGQAAGPMAPVVEALQDAPDADIDALIDWLARQPAHRDPADVVSASEHGERLTTDPALLRTALLESPDPARSGAVLYNTSCASCHGANGSGSPDGRFPSMFHNSTVGARTPYNLIAVLLNGVERHIRSGTVLMQSFDGKKGIVGGLSDDELASLANFVVKQFGNPSTAPFTSQDIEKSRLGWWEPGRSTAARGQLIASGGGPGGAAAACFSCHGLQGQGDAAAGFPRLAGLDASYFAKQMRDYASGARPNGAMSPIARQLDPADYQSLALYYEGLSASLPAVRISSADESLVESGKRLYAEGAPERGIQACADCHGPAGKGFNPIYPSLAQPVSYTEGQLRLWRNGVRRNDPHDLMGSVSRGMSDEDIRAVSAYIAGLAP